MTTLVAIKQRAQLTTLYRIEGASEPNIALCAPATVPEPCVSAFTWSLGRTHRVQAASKLYDKFMERLL